jgi:hypothetical protein
LRVAAEHSQFVKPRTEKIGDVRIYTLCSRSTSIIRRIAASMLASETSLSDCRIRGITSESDRSEMPVEEDQHRWVRIGSDGA